MILVFGGTTEGRAVVETLDVAGQVYYYSTRGDMQQVKSVYGVRISGDMPAEQMIVFGREHDIRLFVDAAHPLQSSYTGILLLLLKYWIFRLSGTKEYFRPVTPVWCGVIPMRMPVSGWKNRG